MSYGQRRPTTSANDRDATAAPGLANIGPIPWKFGGIPALSGLPPPDYTTMADSYFRFGSVSLGST